MGSNWIRCKKGFSVPLALVSGGFLAIMISALSFYSQSELKMVKSLLGKTTSEYAAFSGLMYSYEKLCREGRWYQPGMDSLTQRGLKWKNAWTGMPDSEPMPFASSDSMKVTLFLDEAKAKDKWNLPRSAKKLVNQGQGFELLDHIKVLALGESGGEKSLIFGKYIMMPEPLLNSNSTKGGADDPPGEPEQGEYIVRVPPIHSEKTGYGAKVEPGYIWSQDINLTQRCKIKTVLAAAGQKVRMEDYVLTMNTEWDDGSTKGWATQEPKLRARYDGKVKQVLVKPGDIVKPGDPLVIIVKDIQQKSTQFPLQKMVRVTRIPPEIYRDLNLSKIEDRYKVYEYVGKVRDEYLKNYNAIQDGNLDNKVSSVLETINSGEPRKTVKESELGFPDVKAAGNIEDGGSQFVENLLHNFVPPFGLDPKTAGSFAGSATYRLGVDKREITPQLRELLEIHGQRLHGDKNYYINKLETLPRRMMKDGKDIYTIKSDKPDGATNDYLKLMKEYGVKADPKKGTDGFISSISELKDAAVYSNIYLNQDTPWTPKAFDDLVASGKITDPQNYFRWKNSKGEDGWWKTAPESAITVKSVDVPYYYENPTPITKSTGKVDQNEDPTFSRDASTFRIRMDSLLKFFKKHYDEGSPPKTFEELRPDDDIEDTPQEPPLPDATGCIFSGVSS